MLTAVPLGQDSNAEEDLDICKCIVPLQDGGTLNSRREANPFVRLVEREEGWKTPDHFKGVLLQNWSGTYCHP
ncbi:hypothetical protein TNCV_4277461 [Trichonephila clavipes]|nr:hypothetical protein TNCV_4277461 [Trichonephila clavipes]